MKTLTINIWESDNVEFDVDISNRFHSKIKSSFRKYCAENDYDIEDSLDDPDVWEAFFDDVPLEDIDAAAAARVRKIAEEEVRRSIQENWYDSSDPDGWMKEFEQCTWGFFPVIIEWD